MRASILLCLFSAALASQAIAYEERYLPLTNNVLSKRFRQQLLIDPLEKGNAVSFEKTKLSISETGRLNCYGTDQLGKKWSLTAGSWNGCASVWTADLDKNGKNDLIIAMRTPSDGYEPGAQLIFLMFEKNGRPAPWAVSGFFDIDEHGLKDLLDVDGDGHAELLKQSINDGYWLTTVYESFNAKWKKLNNFNGNDVPLYTRYTEEENRTAIKPPPYRHPYEPDYSNDKSNSAFSRGVFASSIDWKKKKDDPVMYLSNNQRVRLAKCSASAYVSIDDETGRRIAFFSAREVTNKFLNEIRSRHMKVIIKGNSKGELSSEIAANEIAAKSSNSESNNCGTPLDIALLNSTELP